MTMIISKRCSKALLKASFSAPRPSRPFALRYRQTGARTAPSAAPRRISSTSAGTRRRTRRSAPAADTTRFSTPSASSTACVGSGVTAANCCDNARDGVHGQCAAPCPSVSLEPLRLNAGVVLQPGVDDRDADRAAEVAHQVEQARRLAAVPVPEIPTAPCRRSARCTASPRSRAPPAARTARRSPIRDVMCEVSHRLEANSDRPTVMTRRRSTRSDRRAAITVLSDLRDARRRTPSVPICRLSIAAHAPEEHRHQIGRCVDAEADHQIEDAGEHERRLAERRSACTIGDAEKNERSRNSTNADERQPRADRDVARRRTSRGADLPRARIRVRPGRSPSRRDEASRCVGTSRDSAGRRG